MQPAQQKFEEEAKKYYKLNDAEIKDFRKRYTTVDDDTGEALYENIPNNIITNLEI